MQSKQHGWLKFLVGWLLSALVVASGGIPSQAQTVVSYYPQTGHYLRGAFRLFWEQNGGLGTFGYPITEEYIRNQDGKVIQYFERARFELRTVGSEFVIDLGMVGADFLKVQGISFPRIEEPAVVSNALRYFPETGHTIRGAFKTFWETKNGQILFGYPLSEEFNELFPDGKQRTVQYFERARFETQPKGTSLGLLGRALAPCQQVMPRPANNPPPNPLPEGNKEGCQTPDASVNLGGRVYPEVSAPGTTLGFEARGYKAGELISLWLNVPQPDGKTKPRSLPYRATAAKDGYVLIGFRTETTDPEGNWSLVGQGLESKKVVLAPFRLKYQP